MLELACLGLNPGVASYELCNFKSCCICLSVFFLHKGSGKYSISLLGLLQRLRLDLESV